MEREQNGQTRDNTDVDEYLSGWEVALDDSLTLRQNVMENLKCLLTAIFEQAECSIERVTVDSIDPVPTSGDGTGEFVVVVYPLGVDWPICFARKEDPWSSGDDI